MHGASLGNWGFLPHKAVGVHLTMEGIGNPFPEALVGAALGLAGRMRALRCALVALAAGCQGECLALLLACWAGQEARGRPWWGPRAAGGQIPVLCPRAVLRWAQAEDLRGVTDVAAVLVNVTFHPNVVLRLRQFEQTKEWQEELTTWVQSLQRALPSVPAEGTCQPGYD